MHCVVKKITKSVSNNQKAYILWLTSFIFDYLVQLAVLGSFIDTLKRSLIVFLGTMTLYIKY